MISAPLYPINLKTEPTVNSPGAKFNVNDPAAAVRLIGQRIRKIFVEREHVDKSGDPDGRIIVATGLDFPVKYCAGRVTVMYALARIGFMVVKKNETVLVDV